MKKVLSADEFLSTEAIVREFVPTPEIQPDSGVYVQAMSAGAKGRIEGEAARFKETGKGNFGELFTLRIVVECACDAEGNRLFSMAQIDALKKKNSAAITRIAGAGMRLSGFSKADLAAIEKNSGTAQADDSLTD